MIGSKSTQSSEQFMSRTGNHSTKPSAKGFGLLGGGENPVTLLTAPERRASLHAARGAQEARLRELNKILINSSLSHEERQSIAAQRRVVKNDLISIDLQQREVAAAIRGGAPRHIDLSGFIADIVKERMTVPQWKAIVAEAKERQAAHEEKLNTPLLEVNK